MKQYKKILSLAIAIVVPLLFYSVTFANDSCEAPDNGSGTINLPADCPYTAPDEPMKIINGLPPDTTIELDPILEGFSSIVRTPGGSLGGEIQQFDATLDLTVSGTGDLAGFNRHLAVPVEVEIHTGPRTPGDPVQPFPAVMVKLQGELFGDPDFCEFIVTAGTNNGLPGPGFMTLTELPSGDFNVDSFFDITYQIEFEGCPGSQLEDYAGTTTEIVRLKQGSGEVPTIGACCRPDEICIPAPETYCQSISGTYHGDASGCLGDGNGDGYDDLCVTPGCCLASDNGSGTVDLPADCPYTAPDEPMKIIDGLPPGTTIELDPILEAFLNIVRTPGGSLGGEIQQFDATLDLTVSGTGDLTGFTRHLAVPVQVEIHTGPRTPGNPVQPFPAVMVKLQGELFGDPDFCEFIVTAGTNYGLPGPGHITLVQRPSGDFAVDSFFDITYQIEFEGCPGSQLQDYSGTTTETIRLQQGIAADADGDCIPNNQDNCQQVYNPAQLDSNDNCPEPPYSTDPLCGDVCENQCQCDFDDDGNVYPSDLSVFLGEYGRTDCLTTPPLCEADFDDDGNVYPSDLSVFLGEYGRTDCLP